MTYILAYHADAIRRPGKQDVLIEDFKAANPLVPIVDGQFFQLDEDRLIIMNERGEGKEVKLTDFSDLVNAIMNPGNPDVNKVYPCSTVVDACLELDGITRTTALTDKIPVSFKVDSEGVQQWQYRDKTDAELASDISDAAKMAIVVLELEITPRRMRDAIAGNDGGWLEAQEVLIAAERAKIT